ncbi:MAG: RNA-binding cell elongation regulator Jag/EloR [Elusimicrobiota bacterium]
MEPIEIEGRTVAEAVESALSQSGMRRDQVEISVLQEGTPGFMGLGSKPARVRVTEKRWGPNAEAAGSEPARTPSTQASARPPRNSGPRTQRPAARTPDRGERSTPRAAERAPEQAVKSRPSPAEPPRQLTPQESAGACSNAESLVLEMLGLMSIAAPTVTSSWDADLERVKVSVESQDAPLLVGRDGRVLESLQFLTTLMLSRASEAPIAVQVDALSYWEKREFSVLEEARRAIDSVIATGRPVRMEPMDSSMRRLIHRTFRLHKDITTCSEGEGPWRKLVIRPRKD